MQYVHDKDLKPLLNKSHEEILAHVKKVLGINNPQEARKTQELSPQEERKVQELSSLLRREKKFATAVEVAECLYGEKKTPGNLNLYFVAVVNEGNAEKIKELDKKAGECVKDPQTTAEQRIHLHATRLKAANRLQNNGMFEEAYKQIPEEDKTGDNYIVNQYYIYLNRNQRYQELVSHYQSLDVSVRADKRIQERYNYAISKIQAQDSSVFLIAQNSADLQIPKLILQSMRLRVIEITGNTSEIIQKMEEDKSGSRFAVVFGTAFDEFAWGYFLGKVGASNLVILTDDNNAGKAYSDHGFGKPTTMSGDINKWETTNDWKKTLKEPMEKSGLNVYLE